MRRSWLRMFWLGMLVVGAVAGYLVSSGLGARLLHQEIETQLGRLLSGPVSIEEVDFRLSHGLLVEAHELTAYPATNPANPPALRARRVLAWIDIPAMLIGRLELSTLVLEGPHVRVELLPDGTWGGLPFPPVIAPRERADWLPEIDRSLLLLESLEPFAQRFVRNFRAAERIEVRDGTLEWIDHRNASDTTPARSIRLELLQTVTDRDWLSDLITIEAEAVLIDGRHSPFPIRFALDRQGDLPFSWQVEFSQVPVEMAQDSLGSIKLFERISGSLDARLTLDREPDGSPVLSIVASIKNPLIAMRKSGRKLERDWLELETELHLEPTAARIQKGHLRGPRINIELMGQVDRPLTTQSMTRLESRIIGINLEDLRALARPLQAESENALAFLRLTDRVNKGRILKVEAAGSERLAFWQDILAGRSIHLPKGFVFGFDFDEFDVGDAAEDVIEDLEGELEWVGDRITLRDTTATFRGTRLPTLNAVFTGIQHLAEALEEADSIEMSPPAMPGIFPLAEILKPRDPNSLPPVKAIGLAIDQLVHPIFRWPLRDIRVFIEPLRRGAQLKVREGIWGGASVRGELVWFADEEASTISAQLDLGPLSEAPRTDRQAGSNAAPPALPANRWGEGQFEVDFRPRPGLPFQSANGFFRLEGDRLIGNEVELSTIPTGKLAARMTLGLEDPDSVGLDLSFALTDGRLEGIGSFIGLPPDLATGQIGAAGSLAGRMTPDRGFIENLDGKIRADAKQGRIRMGLPIMLRLTKATEGYNPFADQDELRYERMASTIVFEQGVMSTEDFEIEGPLRVFASAEIDTNPKRTQIRAVVGIFLFRGPNQVLENLPLVRYFLPGSERGLIGTWMEVEGPLAEPEVKALPVKTLMSIVPSAIKAPFQILGYLFNRGDDD